MEKELDRLDQDDWDGLCASNLDKVWLFFFFGGVMIRRRENKKGKKVASKRG